MEDISEAGKRSVGLKVLTVKIAKGLFHHSQGHRPW